MNRRKPSRLALCVLETLRSGAAYIAVLRLFSPEKFPSGRFGAAALLAPQLMIPIAWFLLWLSPRANRPYFRLIAAGKALSLAAGVAWMSHILSQTSTRFSLDRIAFLSEVSTQGLFLLADLIFMTAALVSGWGAHDADATGETTMPVPPAEPGKEPS